MIRQMMQRFVVIMVVFAASGAARAQSYLMRRADVHEGTIVFTYEDDLWLVSTEGGDARRLTSDPGAETWAKFSPDGSLIAFTGQYDGGVDVYVMDAAGGVPKRLTYHPGPDLVLGWFPDGKHILFRSRREWPFRAEMIYKVSIDGGMPVKLPVDRAGLTALSPDGTQIAYNRISREDRTWKRHQGGTAQDIWLGSLARRDYRKITDWPGTDNFPMWEGEAIYFNSDREFGTLNIYKYDVPTGTITPMTAYKDYDVKNPSIGTGKIVYQYGETLHLLDLATGAMRQVPVNIPSDLVRMRPELVEVAPSKGSFSLSPSAKRMLLEARGEILNVPVEDGEPINLTRTTGTREKNATWSPDGRWIAFISDKSGEEELYLVDQKGHEPWRQLTEGGKGFRMQPVWSPDSKWLLFSDKFLKLNLVDAATGEITVVDQSEYDDGWYRWGIQDYTWSPDSKWIAYTKLEGSINESIFLYSLEQGTNHRVTDDVHADWSPSFDPKGRYLYFLSHRHLAPIMGFIDQNFICLDMAQPFIVVLKDGEPSPFAPKDSEEEVKEAQDEESEDADASDEPSDKGGEKAPADGGESRKERMGNEGGADAKKEEEEADKDRSKVKEPIQIDLNGIGGRILAAKDVKAGNYFRLEATEKGFLYLAKDEPEFEKYQTVTDETDGSLDLYAYDLEKAETKKVLGGIANYHQSADGKKLVYRAGNKYGVVDVGASASVGDGKVDLSQARITVDRNKEFMQIFNEAWRVQRDWFYDPNMHGVDWAAIGEKYRKFVPHCGDRSDLNYIIGEMIGELNAGHTYVFGGDIERDARRVSIGMLGADFAAEPGAEYYRIAHVIPGTSWDDSERSPLDEVGCPIKEGEYLIAIDGEPITTNDNIYRLLLDKADAVVTLTYNDTPSLDGAQTHRVRTIRSEGGIRYREWVDNNRAAVDAASSGTIGYLHIPDMGRGGLVEFMRHYFPHHYKKGFVIDERYNGGGFTSAMIIDRLERKLFGLTKPREGRPLHEPERVFHGHKIVLVNEDTGSAGEWFAEAIKIRGLCPILGMRTWGGAVGIELHQPLIDEGGTTPPQFAPYGLDGRWLIEGHGVDPDIEVQNMPADVLQGRDSQLSAAIDWLKARLAEDPMEIPPPPPYSDKSKTE